MLNVRKTKMLSSVSWSWKQLIWIVCIFWARLFFMLFAKTANCFVNANTFDWVLWFIADCRASIHTLWPICSSREYAASLSKQRYTQIQFAHFMFLTFLPFISCTWQVCVVAANASQQTQKLIVDFTREQSFVRSVSVRQYITICHVTLRIAHHIPIFLPTGIHSASGLIAFLTENKAKQIKERKHYVMHPRWSMLQISIPRTEKQTFASRWNDCFSVYFSFL